MEIYYLDTSIWLNLFKKEFDFRSGVKYWKIAREFIENVAKTKSLILVSTINLKELYFTSGEKFKLVREFFRTSSYIRLIKTTEQDYNLAREFEKRDGKISFYDYLHIAIAKRLNAILVTRDNDMTKFAENFVKVGKPEDLID